MSLASLGGAFFQVLSNPGKETLSSAVCMGGWLGTVSLVHGHLGHVACLFEMGLDLWHLSAVVTQ